MRWSQAWMLYAMAVLAKNSLDVTARRKVEPMTGFSMMDGNFIIDRGRPDPGNRRQWFHREKGCRVRAREGIQECTVPCQAVGQHGGVERDHRLLQETGKSKLSRGICCHVRIAGGRPRGYQVVYHLAAGIEKSFPGCFMNSVIATRNLLDAFVGHGVPEAVCKREFPGRLFQ